MKTKKGLTHITPAGLLLSLLAAAAFVIGMPPAQASGPGSFASLAKAAKPSVVYISTVKVIKGQDRGGPMPHGGPFGQEDPFRDFFERFFGEKMPRDFKQSSLGSGFIIDEKGSILTNNHVIEGMDEIKVKLMDGKEYDAKIIGRDPTTDIALIKIEPDEPLTYLPLGDSDGLEIGDWVVAIGNPFGLELTVTAGIVSAKYRRIGTGKYENFIQTDASINRGNSGGPLLNTRGDVIGINTAIVSPSGGSIGIGFAIPINMIKDLLPQLREGKVTRGWLGVMIQQITPQLKEKLNLRDEKGALVADVTAGGPAEKAGIERGDVIVAFGGKKIKEMNELPYIVATTPVGTKVDVEIIRRGERRVVSATIAELKEDAEGGPGPTREEVTPNLGMTVQELTPELARNYGLTETSGLVVTEVKPGGPAAEAGIRRGDALLEVDQTPVGDLGTFQEKLREYNKGDTVLFLIKRRGATLYLTLKMWK